MAARQVLLSCCSRGFQQPKYSRPDALRSVLGLAPSRPGTAIQRPGPIPVSEAEPRGLGLPVKVRLGPKEGSNGWTLEELDKGGVQTGGNRTTWTMKDNGRLVLLTHPLLGTTNLPSALLRLDLSAQLGGPPPQSCHPAGSPTVSYLPQAEGPAGSPSKVGG